MPDRSISCHLIGGDSLLMECGEVLLAAGVRVLGVVSAAPRVRAWAQGKGLPCRDLKGPWQAELAREPFDFLFAITHLELLDEQALALPKRGAINFHDGPLPTYAGLYCPVWALLEGAETYGVTWHWIDSGIDTGDVLESESFEVSPHETSLTLNTKCFQAGLGSFERLVRRLLEGDDRSTPQPDGERRLCRANERPASGGLLDWSRPAVELDRLVRALDFGTYPNPFGSAKAIIGERPVLVREAKVQDLSAPGGSVPGAVVAAGPDGIDVACGAGVLRLTALETLEGGELAAESLGQAAGSQLPLPDQAQALALGTVASRQAERRERRLAQRLIHALPAGLPHIRLQPASNQAGGEPGTRTLQLPAKDANGDPANHALELAAGFVGYLARVSGEATFDVAVRLEDWDAAAEPLGPFASARQPVRFTPSLDQPLDGLANELDR